MILYKILLKVFRAHRRNRRALPYSIYDDAPGNVTNNIRYKCTLNKRKEMCEYCVASKMTNNSKLPMPNTGQIRKVGEDSQANEGNECH